MDGNVPAKPSASSAGVASAGAALVWLAAAVAGKQAVIDLRRPGEWDFGFRLPGQIAGHELAILMLALVATLGTIQWWRTYKYAIRASRQTSSLLLLAAGWVVVTTLLARDAKGYATQLVLTLLAHAGGVACLLLAARSLPHAWMLSFAGEEGKRRARVAVSCAAIGVTVVSAVIAVTVFERVPHVPDDIAYLFQARTYATGRMFVDAPPVPELFQQFLIGIRDGKWFSVFPPGWPMVLALGVVAGVPWLVNPVLAGIGVLLTYRVVSRMYSPGFGAFASVLLAISPLYVFVGATYMAHPLSIVLALVSILSALELGDGKSDWWALLGGAALGWLAATRPIEAVSLAAILIAFKFGAFGKGLNWRQFALAATAAIVCSMPFFVNNRVLTGSPFRDPVQQYFDETFYPGSNTLGFGPTKGNFGWPNDILPGHSIVESLIHVDLNVNILDAELFGWFGGGLLFVAALVFAWRFARRERKNWLWIALIVATVLPAMGYWYSGADLGPRYWYQTLVPWTVLTVAGALAAAQWLGIDKRALATVILATGVIGLMQNLTWRGNGKYHNYRGVSGAIGPLIDRYGMQNGLIFVRDRAGDEIMNFGSAFIWNGVPLSEGPILARYGTAEERAELRRRFPGRSVWVITAASKSGLRFAVESGPSAADARNAQSLGARSPSARIIPGSNSQPAGAIR